MTFKELIDEELSLNSVGQKMSQLGVALNGLNKKVASNPILAQTLGVDLNNLNQLSGETQNDFKALVSQNLIDQKQKQQAELKKQKEDREEEQKKAALLANNKKQDSGNVNANTQANNPAI